MEKEKLFNDLLVMLFNEVLDMENRALITGSFKEISINDMHIIDAVGISEPRNMSTVAKAVSLTEKGIAAYEKHAAFHRQMVKTVMDGFEGEEMEILARALEKLRRYFKEPGIQTVP